MRFRLAHTSASIPFAGTVVIGVGVSGVVWVGEFRIQQCRKTGLVNLLQFPSKAVVSISRSTMWNTHH